MPDGPAAVAPPDVKTWRDHRLVGAARKDGPPGSRLVLGLDLGTSCGFAWAWLRPGEPLDWSKIPVFMGRYDMRLSDFESKPTMLLRLQRLLSEISPDLICFEEIRNTPGRETVTRFNMSSILARVSTASQLAGALMGAVALWAEERGIPCVAVPIGRIKKRATGLGNASKVEVARACNEAFGTSLDLERLEACGDDDVADAAWTLVTGAEEYVDGLDAGVHAGRGEAGAAAPRRTRRAAHPPEGPREEP